MRVFVTGATGYVGFNVALAFRRAGHRVWGLIRSEEKAKKLLRHEIIPVTGFMQQPESYMAAARECSVLVHAASDVHGDTAGLDLKTIETLISLGKEGPQPKTLVYTSGAWGYGDTGNTFPDETAPQNPARLIAWRPGHEEVVLHAKGVRGLVIRPGCVYGKQGSLTNAWFKGAYVDKELKVVGDGRNRWAMVHADDLARAYVHAAESGLSGEIFNINDSSCSTVGQMVDAVAKAAGYDGEIRFVPLAEAAKTMGDFAEALALDQHIDNRKAMRILGWKPRHPGFVEGVKVYFETWRAYQDS
jgi:nucleoside-diphosphate-sugar epimerase